DRGRAAGRNRWNRRWCSGTAAPDRRGGAVPLIRVRGCARVALSVALPVLMALAPPPMLSIAARHDVQVQQAQTGILAVVGRQVAWLNLEAPRHRQISRIATPANALDVTAQLDGTHVVVAVGGPFPGAGTRGAHLSAADL